MVPLKPQDVVVLLRLLSSDGDRTYPRLAQALGMSASEVHASVQRAAKAGLVRLSAIASERPESTRHWDRGGARRATTRTSAIAKMRAAHRRAECVGG